MVAVAIANGISAVSELDASAIARSKPATFWKRLITRSTNPGRSQNVSDRNTRPRSAHAGAPASGFGLVPDPVTDLRRVFQVFVRVSHRLGDPRLAGADQLARLPAQARHMPQR